MNQYEYLNLKFPESRYEDGDFGIDELYESVAQAYEDGFKDAINKAVEWLQEQVYDRCIEMHEDGIEDFRKDMQEHISWKY